MDYLDSEIDVDVRIDQAVLLTRNKQYEKAEKIFRQIIKDDPSLVGPAFNNFAVELRKSGKVDKSFEIYKEILEHDIPDKNIVIENFKTAGLNHANKLREDFKQEEAITIYKSILQCGPRGKEWVLCELAVAYLEIQDQAQASSGLMEAIYINPRMTTLDKFKENYPDLSSLKEEMVKKLSGLAL